MGLEVVGNTSAYTGAKSVQADSRPRAESDSSAASVAMQSMERPSTLEQLRNDAGAQAGDQGQPTEKQIMNAISSANKRARFGHTNAEFSYHEATKRISVKIIDKDTNEVIKEIPPEETLDMISKMWELAGILVDEKR